MSNALTTSTFDPHERLISIVKKWTNQEYWQYANGRHLEFNERGSDYDKVLEEIRSHLQKDPNGNSMAQHFSLQAKRVEARTASEESLAAITRLIDEWVEMRSLLELTCPQLLGEFRPVTSFETLSNEQIDDRCQQMNRLLSLLVDRKAPPRPMTIWYQGEMSYSLDGRTPVVVSREEHNILQSFLKNDTAKDTRTLEKEAAN